MICRPLTRMNLPPLWWARMANALFAVGGENDPRGKEGDARRDRFDQTQRIKAHLVALSELQTAQLLPDDDEQAGRDGHHDMCAQPRRLVPALALKPHNARQKRGHQQPRGSDSDRHFGKTVGQIGEQAFKHGISIGDKGFEE